MSSRSLRSRELVPPDHPLRPIRAVVDRQLEALNGRVDETYEEG